MAGALRFEKYNPHRMPIEITGCGLVLSDASFPAKEPETAKVKNNIKGKLFNNLHILKCVYRVFMGEFPKNLYL